MTRYNIRLTEDAAEYVAALDEKSARIVEENLQKLTTRIPVPGAGRATRRR
ncbi:MAG: hypothetical protein ABEH78_05625 [Haloferacaceae archaeon]